MCHSKYVGLSDLSLLDPVYEAVRQEERLRPDRIRRMRSEVFPDRVGRVSAERPVVWTKHVFQRSFGSVRYAIHAIEDHESRW